MAERKLVVVRSPFFAGRRMVGVGEVWGADDPIVKSYPNAFRDLEVKTSVEPQARTSPARRTTRPAKRQAKKS
jgi:hypothetical protein